MPLNIQVRSLLDLTDEEQDEFDRIFYHDELRTDLVESTALLWRQEWRAKSFPDYLCRSLVLVGSLRTFLWFDIAPHPNRPHLPLAYIIMLLELVEARVGELDQEEFGHGR